MSKLVIFSVVLGATLLACEPAKTPSVDGGDASVTVVVVDAAAPSPAPASVAAPAPVVAAPAVVVVKADAGPAKLDAGKK